VLKGKGNYQCRGTGDETLQGAVSGPWGYEGANIAFGVREHGMGSIINGIALHGGLLPFASTFLIFSDYMRPSIRLAALMRRHVVYIFTHDSIALGEDGPTHQPIEQLSSLRAIPNLTVIRPADANETAVAWKMAMEEGEGPVALILTRQNVPVIDRDKFGPATGLIRGGYVLADSAPTNPEIIIIATGSEVHPSIEAYEALLAEGVRTRVVSMPSWEIFERQPEDYRHQVLPPEVTARISIEAGATHGWHKYVGLEGKVIGIDRFGASAPGATNLRNFGFSAENIVAKARLCLNKKK
jgi:transketolase